MQRYIDGPAGLTLTTHAGLQIVVLIVVALLPTDVSAGPFSKIVVFGESTSDAGNQFAASQGAFPPTPPYFEGRWTNGPTWIDLVSTRLGLGHTVASENGGTNFAFGGTTTGDGYTTTNCSDMGLDMCFDLPGPNYGMQIDTFLSSQPTIDDDHLFVIWGGHNDIFRNRPPTTVAQNLKSHVETLIEQGATNLVLLNLFSVNDEADSANTLLHQELGALRREHQATTILEVDVPQMFAEFFADPGGINTFGQSAMDTKTLEVVDNPDAYLDWDGVHLTAAFNRVIADYVLREMDNSLLRQGDFDGDQLLTAVDIDALAHEMKSTKPSLLFDLNRDNTVDLADHRSWIHDLKRTWLGDANLDGEFNSSDLTAVFQSAKYELDVDAGWAQGDWTGDLRFGTDDLTAAFQESGYEVGPRGEGHAVPEPASFVLALAGLIAMAIGRQRTRALGAAGSPEV